METKYITLRENTPLVKLSLYTNETIDFLTDKIISCLIKEKCLYDFPEYCGSTLEFILQENGHKLESFAVHCFKFCKPSLLTILKGVQIWGLTNDCEECGCEMDEDETEKECSNPVCDCSIQTVFERDPDQYRDDCPIELLTEFNQN